MGAGGLTQDPPTGQVEDSCLLRGPPPSPAGMMWMQRNQFPSVRRGSWVWWSGSPPCQESGGDRGGILCPQGRW